MKRYRITIVLFIFSLVSIFLVARKDMNSSIEKLLPLKDKSIAEQYRVMSEFNFQNRVIFEISSRDSLLDFSKLSSYAEYAMKHLSELSVLEFENGAEPAEFLKLRNSIIKKWPALFSQEDSAYISSKLNYDTLYNRFNKTISSLYSLASQTDQFELINDPFSVGNFALSKLQSFSPSDKIRIKDGYLTNEENNRIIFFAKCKNKAMSGRNGHMLRNEIEAVANSLDSSGIKLVWMGAVRAALDNEDTIKRDVNLTLPITISVILLICILIFRNLKSGFVAFVPTLVSMLITLGLFSIFTDLSLIIVGFSASLLGITIDFAIHILYASEIEGDGKLAIQKVRRPILASAFTTAGAFILLLFTNIPSLVQLGLLTSVGIVVSAFVSIFLLEELIGNKKRTAKAYVDLTTLFRKFYTTQLDKYITVGLIVFSIIMYFFAFKIKFNGDPDFLNGMKKETIEIEASLNKNWGDIEGSIILSLHATSFKELQIKLEKKLDPLLKFLENSGYIKKQNPYYCLFPSDSTKTVNIKRWKSIFTNEKINLIHSVIDSICSVYGLPKKSFDNYFEYLSIKQYLRVDPSEYSKYFADNMLSNFIRRDTIGYTAILPISLVKDYDWHKISEECRKYDVVPVYRSEFGFRIVDIIKSGFSKIIIYIPVAILLILSLILRKPLYIAFSVFPTIVSLGITFGIMSLLGVTLNIVTLMVVAFVFGLGVDYTLMMLHMGMNKDIEQISHAATSVTVAALTTLAGLGVLAFANHPVLHILGVTGLVGIIPSYASAIILIPLLMRKFT